MYYAFTIGIIISVSNKPLDIIYICVYVISSLLVDTLKPIFSLPLLKLKTRLQFLALSNLYFISNY